MTENKKYFLTMIVTVGLAFVGYTYSYTSELSFNEMQAKRDRKNRQTGMTEFRFCEEMGRFGMDTD